ncbi:uncharacterized protein BCR38DRAFT_102404 [Pseudomassariella vexata]|uniref:Secreted protein n=1 Tax=Pseudomassariella vexata TaxID=1141098 RepID=A0A1Y2EF66_9PEZI|nr:uncharacterized protein BCR38DRAFT_102404 [Pseudomassariella vexata]ORY70221.1 hypothetical protein BCR38DRAFT_102404 [Pseudomassariella vexata]
MTRHVKRFCWPLLLMACSNVDVLRAHSSRRGKDKLTRAHIAVNAWTPSLTYQPWPTKRRGLSSGTKEVLCVAPLPDTAGPFAWGHWLAMGNPFGVHGCCPVVETI